METQTSHKNKLATCFSHVHLEQDILWVIDFSKRGEVSQGSVCGPFGSKPVQARLRRGPSSPIWVCLCLRIRPAQKGFRNSFWFPFQYVKPTSFPQLTSWFHKSFYGSEASLKPP